MKRNLLAVSANALKKRLGLGRKSDRAAEFDVSSATLKDVDDLVALGETFRSEHSSAWGEGSMGQWARWQVKGSVQSPDHVVILGRAGATPVGYVSGVIDRTGPAPMGKIEAVFVLQGFRGTGLAARLLTQAIEGLAARGAQEVELVVSSDNARAQAFFASFGLRGADRVMGLELKPNGDGEPGGAGRA